MTDIHIDEKYFPKVTSIGMAYYVHIPVNLVKNYNLKPGDVLEIKIIRNIK